MDSIRVGLLGFGVVGTGTYKMLQDNKTSITRRVGTEIEIARIGIKNLDKPRPAPKEFFTNDLESIVNDPTLPVIVEVIGGIDPAYQLIKQALANGKHVVTANKELIAKHGPELMRLAAKKNLDLHFEAAVGGGIPLIQPLKHQLAGNDVLKLMGIVNGTTNYILTQMTEQRSTLAAALQEAQAKGYAEADPTADVDGFDAQYKISILASLGFSKEVHVEHVYREGIRGVAAEDIHFADMMGYRIKLLGIVEPKAGGLLVRVHPTLLPKKHPLANIHDVYNAVWIRGDFVGDVILSGRGAGSEPTASSVVGDLIDVGRNIRLGGAANVVIPEPGGTLLPIEAAEGRYYLRMHVDDKPRVLGAIALKLGEQGVGLAAMEMRVIDEAAKVGEIVFLTHVCLEADFRRAIAALGVNEGVQSIQNWIRVEE
jgi:homoserine dehydrogenase